MNMPTWMRRFRMVPDGLAGYVKEEVSLTACRKLAEFIY